MTTSVERKAISGWPIVLMGGLVRASVLPPGPPLVLDLEPRQLGRRWQALRLDLHSWSGAPGDSPGRTTAP